MAKKRGFLEGYKTYDPEVEGYGSPDQWRDAFFERLGIDKAQEVLGEDDPLTLLGLSGNPSWDEIMRAYRRVIMACHPDRNPENYEEALEKAKKINAAFEVLENRYKK